MDMFRVTGMIVCPRFIVASGQARVKVNKIMWGFRSGLASEVGATVAEPPGYR